MSWQPGQPPGWQTPGWQPGDGGGFVPVQPILPITKPGFRTIDAKTLADVYNAGLPQMPDYTWPNGRKFYQP